MSRCRYLFMAITNHIPGPAAYHIDPQASRAVAAIVLIVFAAIVGLVIIGVVAGLDVPAMEDFSAANPFPPSDPSAS